MAFDSYVSAENKKRICTVVTEEPVSYTHLTLQFVYYQKKNGLPNVGVTVAMLAKRCLDIEQRNEVILDALRSANIDKLISMNKEGGEEFLRWREAQNASKSPDAPSEESSEQ